MNVKLWSKLEGILAFHHMVGALLPESGVIVGEFAFQCWLMCAYDVLMIFCRRCQCQFALVPGERFNVTGLCLVGNPLCVMIFEFKLTLNT